MQTKIVNVDGHNLNAAHFGAMSAEEGPKRIIQDGFTKDEAWAKKAHALCVEAVTPKAEARSPGKDRDEAQKVEQFSHMQ